MGTSRPTSPATRVRWRRERAVRFIPGSIGTAERRLERAQRLPALGGLVNSYILAKRFEMACLVNPRAEAAADLVITPCSMRLSSCSSTNRAASRAIKSSQASASSGVAGWLSQLSAHTRSQSASNSWSTSMV